MCAIQLSGQQHPWVKWRLFFIYKPVLEISSGDVRFLTAGRNGKPTLQLFQTVQTGFL